MSADRKFLIDRQADDLISRLSELRCQYNCFDENERDAYRTLSEAIKALSDVAQVRQTAEWIYGEKDGADGWYCSKCKFHIPWYYEYYGLKNINFIRDFHTCPHCDAKMMRYTGMKGAEM